MSLRVVLFASVFAVSSALTLYNPPQAGAALDALEQALAKIVASPHLTKDQLAEAKKVSADVTKTVDFLESAEGKKLTKEAKGAKVMTAIKELQGLQDHMQQASEDKKADLMKQLKAKEEELVKDKKMLKVINLEKALAEKKLALQKLIDQKNEKANAANAVQAQKDAAAQEEMVAKVLSVAKSLKEAKPSDKKPVSDDKLKTVMTYLEGRTKTVADSLAKLDAAEKKREDEIKTLVNTKAPVQDGKDPLAKGQGILKMLLKKEQRAFKKSRATFQNELNQLHQATASIKKGDVAGLSKVMTQMQGEEKSLKAKSGKFLY